MAPQHKERARSEHGGRYSAERKLEKTVEAFCETHGVEWFDKFNSVLDAIAECRQAGTTTDAVKSVVEDTVGFCAERVLFKKDKGADR